jgi:DNA-binding FrmR family transcriptional regulator
MDTPARSTKALVEAAAGLPSYLTPESAKRLADRLARAEGHLRSVRQMVLDHRCADEILLQIVAVKAAINQVTAQILEHELNACVVECMPGSTDERLKKVTQVLATLLRHG